LDAEDSEEPRRSFKRRITKKVSQNYGINKSQFCPKVDVEPQSKLKNYHNFITEQSMFNKVELQLLSAYP